MATPENYRPGLYFAQPNTFLLPEIDALTAIAIAALIADLF